MKGVHIVSVYTLFLHCLKCDHEDEVATDGPTCYFRARKIAIKRGWKLRKDGFAICPNHIKNHKVKTGE